MLVLPAGVSTLVGLTIRDYVGEKVHSMPARFTYPSRTSNSPPVVQDFSALPGCYAASVPALIAGYWSAFHVCLFFLSSPYLMSPCAGLHPSLLRVSYETLHLPSVLTTTRRIFCSCNVESVCLVERSVGRSTHIGPDGIFKSCSLERSILISYHQARDSAVYFFM